LKRSLEEIRVLKQMGCLVEVLDVSGVLLGVFLVVESIGKVRLAIGCKTDLLEAFEVPS
jgi:hypothetical protein